MSPNEIAKVLSIGLSFCAAWYFIACIYRNFAVDDFRDKMFALRDEFFDAANDGLIDFDHLAYGLLRSTMNGFIRHANKLTFFDCVVTMLVLRKQQKTLHEFSFTGRWEDAITALPEEAKTDLEKYRTKMLSLAIKHVIFSSPFLMFIVIPPTFLFVLQKNLCTSIRCRIMTLFQNTFGCSMQSTALAYGKEALAA